MAALDRDVEWRRAGLELLEGATDAGDNYIGGRLPRSALLTQIGETVGTRGMRKDRQYIAAQTEHLLSLSPRVADIAWTTELSRQQTARIGRAENTDRH